MGDLLIDGGRLGVTALNIKKFKTKSLNDEMLLNKKSGMYYYKTPDGDIISIDYSERVDQIKNAIMNEMSKNLLFNFKILHLNIAPTVIDVANVQELLNPTLSEANFESLPIESSKSDKYALSLFLDIIETTNDNEEYTKFLVNNIYDTDYTATVGFTDSVNTTNTSSKELSAKFTKLENTLGADLTTLTGNVTIKNILLQPGTIDAGKSRHLLGVYIIAVRIDDKEVN